MFRLFISQSAIDDTSCILSDDDFHYMSRVLRLKKGEEIDIIIDEVLRYRVVVQLFEKNKLYFELRSKHECIKSTLELFLFQCLPKGDKFSDIINQATQLSCSHIIPLFSSRSMIKLDDKKIESKMSRWNQIAKQASQQSQQHNVTIIHPPSQLMSLQWEDYQLDRLFVFWEDEKNVSLKSELSMFQQEDGSVKKIGVLIGPEGGLAPSEVSFLKNQGGSVVSLGPSIYRTEIASLVCMSQIIYHFQ